MDTNIYEEYEMSLRENNWEGHIVVQVNRKSVSQYGINSVLIFLSESTLGGNDGSFCLTWNEIKNWLRFVTKKQAKNLSFYYLLYKVGN